MASTPHRLHISGLAPTTKPADLVSRFTSFGTIVGGENAVGGLGLDANGNPRTFAFVTLETTQAKLAKCTSMLSGSMWKGHKLRIALAKPDYQTRMATERETLKAGNIKTPKRKRRKHNPDPNVGEPARHWELITVENIKQHSGWTIDADPGPSPLFPLVARPPHPLRSLPQKAAATSWTRETLRAKAAREKKEARKLANITPVHHARRIRIDVRKWGRIKKVFGDEEGTGRWDIKGGWECVEDEEEEGESDKVRKGDAARWVFKAPDGTIKRTETVRLGRTSAYTDSFKASLDALALAGPIPTPNAPLPSFAIDIPGELDVNPVAGARAKSLSPPPYVPLAPRTLLYNEEDAFALRTTTLDEDEAAASRESERLAQLEVLKALMGGAEKILSEDAEEVIPQAKGKVMPAVEGFGDEDDEEEFQEVLRLRGAGGEGEWEESDSSDTEVLRLRGGGGDSSEDDSEDEEDAAEMEVDVGAPKSSKTSVSMGTLKDMFKPQEASSFSMLSGLDLDLDPIERTPSPPPASVQFPTTYRAPAAAPAGRGGFVPPPALERHNRAWIGTGPLTPFFAFPSGRFEGPDGSIAAEQLESLGLPEERTTAAAVESAKRLGDGAASFWRSESSEKIEEEHQKLRELLRGHARKRHREAAKKGKKKPMSVSSSSVPADLFKAVISRRGAYGVVLSTVLGTSLWHSFIGGPLQYKYLPRQMFGTLQSHLFPPYFAIQSLGSAALLALWLRARRVVKGPTVGFRLNAWLLGIMAVGGFVNLVAVGPWTSGIMAKRHRLERLEGTSYTDENASPALRKLSAKFGIAHSISALLNLGVMFSALLHSSWIGEFGSAL